MLDYLTLGQECAGARAQRLDGRVGQQIHLDTAARKMVSEMGDRAASSGLVSKASFVRSAYQTISMALVRANARVYDVSLERVARTVGRQFEAGSSVPIADVVESF